jgi:hypothetical protein
MTQEELISRIEYRAGERLKLLRAKGEDYAGQADAFAAFKSAADFAGVDLTQALDVMIGIKIARIRSLRGRPANYEKLWDTVADLINYLELKVVLLDSDSDLFMEEI